MGMVIVRYRVAADRAEENVAAVQAVFAALDRERPAGLRYATFRLADGVTFVHLASIETADGTNPLLAVEAFRKFSADIADRCEERPVVTPAAAIGSYRLLPSEGG